MLGRTYRRNSFLSSLRIAAYCPTEDSRIHLHDQRRTMKGSHYQGHPFERVKGGIGNSRSRVAAQTTKLNRRVAIRHIDGSRRG
jgi:hypothetical protein